MGERNFGRNLGRHLEYLGVRKYDSVRFLVCHSWDIFKHILKNSACYKEFWGLKPNTTGLTSGHLWFSNTCAIYYGQ